MPFDKSDPYSVGAYLDGELDAQPAPEFDAAISAAEGLIEKGDWDMAEGLARILLHPGRRHDAAAAYRWFYIALSHRGYLTAYANEYEGQGGPYCGPVGDFRNEDEVSMCIAELGLERLRELDREASGWLAAHGA